MTLTRRQFIAVGLSAGGGLLVSTWLPAWGGPAPPTSSVVLPPPSRLNTFLSLDAQGLATVTIPVPEMGQGVRTSLAMLVADEMEVPWEDVRVVQADAADDLGPHPFAGGSWSVRAYWLPLREVGATAREALRQAAAGRWGVDPAECTAEQGLVRHRPSGRRYGYGALAAEAAARPVPAEARLKEKSEFRLIGSSLRHLDVPEIVTGAARFGLDARPPGLLYAAVSRCPVYGGTVRSLDDAEAQSMPGVRAVVRTEAIGAPERPYVPEGVAVVAESTWAAFQARDRLRIAWDEGPNAKESTDRLHGLCRELLERPAELYREGGDVDRGLRVAEKRLDAVYHTPLLVHVPMEPMNCVVHVRENGCEIWAPTQIPIPVRATVADQLGVPTEAVTVHVTRIGGGFGRRLSADFILEALPVARAMGVPVQVVWTREEDVRHGHLRPFTYHRLEAGLNREGRITAWFHRQAGTSRYAFREGLHPGQSEFRSGTYPAALVPDHRLEYALAESNLARGPLRAPGSNTLAFAVESFLDEVAHAAGRNPLEMRLELLGAERELPNDKDDPVFSTLRMANVLRLAAERAGWGRRLPEGHGHGVAVAHTFGTYVAQVAEASVDPATGRVRVHRVVCAIDCGQPVNRSGIAAQVEGSVVDGLGAALYGEITLVGGRIQQSNFHDYPLLRFSEAPEVEVVIVESDLPPTGVGEPPYPPVAPAVANAVFAASGARVRQLPMNPARIREALAGNREG